MILKLLDCYGVDDQYVYELEVINSESSETTYVYLSRNIHFYLKDKIVDIGSLHAMALFPETVMEAMVNYHYWEPISIEWDKPVDSAYVKTAIELIKNEFLWFDELNQS